MSLAGPFLEGRVCLLPCMAQLPPAGPDLRLPSPPKGLFWERSSGCCWLLYFSKLFMALLSP